MSAGKLAVALFLIILFGFLVGCDGGGRESRGPEAPVSAVKSGEGFTVSLEVSPEAAPTGGNMALTLIVTNKSGEERTFDLNTGQIYEFTAYYDNGDEAWRWSEGMFFTQVINEIRFEAGQSEAYKVSWSTVDVKPGDYTVDGYFLGLPDLRPSVRVEVEAGKAG